VEYRILGPLEVRDGGRSISLGTAKQQALLAVLVLHANEFVARERLIDELWGEAPSATAAKAVQVYVSHLRKLLATNGAEAIRTASAALAGHGVAAMSGQPSLPSAGGSTHALGAARPPGCEVEFQPGPRHRVTCSSACRQRLYRARVAER
jgi:hypothetical protein